MTDRPMSEQQAPEERPNVTRQHDAGWLPPWVRRGCTCADVVYHPDPYCPEHGLGSAHRRRQESEIGYGP